MPRFAVLALSLSLLLAGCGDGEPEAAPGGVTQGEAAALNDAAAMLDNDAMAPDPATARP